MIVPGKRCELHDGGRETKGKHHHLQYADRFASIARFFRVLSSSSVIDVIFVKRHPNEEESTGMKGRERVGCGRTVEWREDVEFGSGHFTAPLH